MLSTSCVVTNKLDDLNSEQVEKEIARNPKFGEFAAICGKLGALDDFRLVRKSIGKDGSELYYYFQSSVRKSQASEAFSAYLLRDGWSRLDQAGTGRMEVYKRNDLRVTIQYGGLTGADYGITCGMNAK